eukprot:c32785_g1_i1 orf=1-297(-)
MPDFLYATSRTRNYPPRRANGPPISKFYSSFHHFYFNHVCRLTTAIISLDYLRGRVQALPSRNIPARSSLKSSSLLTGHEKGRGGEVNKQAYPSYLAVC